MCKKARKIEKKDDEVEKDDLKENEDKKVESNDDENKKIEMKEENFDDKQVELEKENGDDKKAELNEENVNHKIEPEMNSQQQRTSVDQVAQQELVTADQNANLIVLLTKLIETLDKLKNSLEKMIESSESSLTNDNNNDELTIGLEIDNATDFINGLSTETKESERHFLKGILWHVRVKIQKAQGEVKWLSIHLSATPSSPSLNKWSINSKLFDICILNLQNMNPDKYQKRSNKIFNNEMSRWGYPKFITIEELKNGGFIKNDRIKIEVYIKLDELVKC